CSSWDSSLSNWVF
nr:immunoglobulin light chain junction region [Macaca mulatta]MPO04629.1 immunoglobulin light chain junction region [Macaca mulatta]MPO05096.1 immunoglobulin light chain junction region [Macaca mulatta]MPO09307.1 immunoglobulin light chain junction region [Macaca mulatta]MPO10268.1 immunoglobulin light chain junction region [Macaca mulatta]